ncbi:MAG: hypothetical protein ACXVPN_07490 [Bacteroidia bacterium]
MGIREITKLFTNIAFVLGILAVATCFLPNLLFYGMIASLAGTIISIIVISVRTHYNVPTTWKHRSIIALVLCSAPVLYLLALIFLHKA